MNDLSSHPDVQRLSARDAEAALALSRAERWPHDLRDWRTMLELGCGLGTWRPGGQGARHLGSVGLVFRHGEAAATVGMVIVGADQRGLGLGRRVMEALVDEAGPARTLWLYATELGAPLYQKLGFEEIGATLSFRGSLTQAAPARSEGIRLATAADREPIEALDLEVFGAPRRDLLERLLQNEGRLCVAESSGGLEGYAAIRGVGSGWQIGPVVASGEALAFDLIGFLGRGAERPLRIDLPESAADLRRALESAGLAALPREPLMVRGASIPGDRGRLFAVASSAYG